MAKEKGEKKGLGALLENSPIGGLIAGKPWLIFVAIGVIVVVIVLIIVATASRGSGNSGSTTTVNPGFLTAAIVYGDDRFADHDDGGRLIGTEPTLAAGLAEAEGLERKILEAATGAEALALLDTSSADIALGRFTSDQNLTGYVVSDEYARGGLFLVTALHDYTDSLGLMTGYSVGVLDSVQKTAESISGYEFISARSYTDAVTMGEDVRDRAVNMGICAERDAISLVKAFPNALQTQEIANGPKERYLAVFPKRSAGHATIFNVVLNSQGVQ